jgi:hypothetical protein
MTASCNYSGAAESDRSLHVHSTSTANVQQVGNCSILAVKIHRSSWTSAVAANGMYTYSYTLFAQF